MYRTCAFCDAALSGDGGPSGLGVGRRIAFDEQRGRLWVVCPACARWNLAPLDDRLERIEAVARAARAGRTVAATAQVSLIRWERYELVRVGAPPRVELAGWRYGERLKARERERALVVVPVMVAAVGVGIAVNAAAGGSFGIFFWNLGRLADGAYVALLGSRRVILPEPPICDACGTVLRLRARHLRHGRITHERHESLALLVQCPHCGAEAALLTGTDAAQALRRGLTFLNAARSARRRADVAARHVDGAGGAEQLIRDVARSEPTLAGLAPERRLALEMAVDEVAEVAELERQWKDAEELADIADGVLSQSEEIDEHLRQLKARGGDIQPSG
ncbi:MAG TPA: hypothetical protein VLV16_05310 [Gemmatimonadales bacterium]|nr:hypothetical protein [Gemmatimonadales bacterium]